MIDVQVAFVFSIEIWLLLYSKKKITLGENAEFNFIASLAQVLTGFGYSRLGCVTLKAWLCARVSQAYSPKKGLQKKRQKKTLQIVGLASIVASSVD